MQTSILDGFFIDFGTIFGAKIASKSIQIQSKNRFGCEVAFKTAPETIFGPNLDDFGSIFFDFSGPRSIKIWACIRIPFQDAFQTDFWTNLDEFCSILGPIFWYFWCKIDNNLSLYAPSLPKRVQTHVWTNFGAACACCVCFLRVPRDCLLSFSFNKQLPLRPLLRLSQSWCQFLLPKLMLSSLFLIVAGSYFNCC